MKKKDVVVKKKDVVVKKKVCFKQYRLAFLVIVMTAPIALVAGLEDHQHLNSSAFDVLRLANKSSVLQQKQQQAGGAAVAISDDGQGALVGQQQFDQPRNSLAFDALRLVSKLLDQQQARFNEVLSDDKIEIKEIYKNSELHDEVLKSKGIVFLGFYVTMCPAGIKMISILESIALEFKDNLKIFKVNYDKAYETIFKELWNKHDIKVRILPSLLVFKDGKFVEMTDKVMSRKELSAYVQKFIN